jgi:putative heme-binding domain-containing protein
LTAARLLYESDDPIDNDAIRNVLRGGSPAGRVAALLVLDGLHQLSDEDLLAALADRDASVRRLAVRLAEPRLAESESLHRRVAEIASEQQSEDAERFQAILGLAAAPDEALTRAIHTAATSDQAKDPWLQSAILCSFLQDRSALLCDLCDALAGREATLVRNQLPLIEQMAEQMGMDGKDEEMTAVIPRFARGCGSQETEEVRPILDRACLLGLGQGLGRRGKLLREWISAKPGSIDRLWHTQLDDAAAVAADNEIEVWIRQQALELLKQGSYEAVSEDLRGLMDDSTPTMRSAAIRAMAGFDRSETAEALLEDIADRVPTERRAVFEAILGGRAMAAYLVERIVGGTLDVSLLDAATRGRLLNHPDEELRHLVRASLAGGDVERGAVIQSYQAAADGAGDAVRGRVVFERHCAACHRVGGVGAAVGPDVADNYNKTREQLLVAILDPNRLIDSSYEAYVAVTKSGRTLQGLLAEETPTAVTLKESEGRTTTISRDEIEELYPTGISLMPVEIEKDIDLAAMTDLLTFLKGWRQLAAGLGPGGPAAK